MKKSMLLSVGAMVFATSALAGKEEKVQWVGAASCSTENNNCNSGGAKVEEIEKETKLKGGRTIKVYDAR